MSRARKPAQPITSTTGHKAELVKLMQGMAHRHDLWRVFSDFVEMAAVSIANACDRSNPDHATREARYMEIVKAYRPDELQDFARMLAHLAEALGCGLDDVLGEVFMELELGSKWHGQFFTPFELCRLMAAVNLDGVRATVERQGFVTVNEPACGGGAMLIALADEMGRAGMNYQRQMHCVAQDLDLKAVHMAYVQLSLLHIPAVVIHGNTLAVETRSRWLTPAHIMGNWSWKLRHRDSAEDPPEMVTPMPPAAVLRPANEWQQDALF